MKLTNSGVELTLTYVEPTQNEDNSQLEDLHHTSIYYSLDAGITVVHVIDLPASLMTGGGEIAYSFSVPVVPGQSVDMLVWATATDTSDNMSAPSEKLIMHIDRIAPKPPF